jgi:hypothetical protein
MSCSLLIISFPGQLWEWKPKNRWASCVHRMGVQTAVILEGRGNDTLKNWSNQGHLGYRRKTQLFVEMTCDTSVCCILNLLNLKFTKQ